MNATSNIVLSPWFLHFFQSIDLMHWHHANIMLEDKQWNELDKVSECILCMLKFLHTHVGFIAGAYVTGIKIHC